MSGGNLTPLNDDDIEKSRKNGKLRRDESIDDQFTKIIIALMWAFAGIALLGALYCLVLYGIYLVDSSVLPKESAETIKSLGTHIAAALGGYVGHIAKRNISEK